ncbi:hypothetical protein Dsin_020890 [Dipteronia sinensis]|uniref:Leucine-rich repeat-containing N-terminal plant-type domain-containing protein n=1 Tax=Dipteronia sinensis TaxID=43782 RepID=A0AAE0AAS2_9ROSI|nr:hypothetical protein Dsin_020890 [Dipteronia sinensis]
MNNYFRPNRQSIGTNIFVPKAHITNDPHNFLADNWTASTSVCNSVGITCDSQNNRVIALNLTSMNLTGTIPPQVGNLSFLVQLRLKNNSFYGSLPMDRASSVAQIGNPHIGIQQFSRRISALEAHSQWAPFVEQ